MGGSNFPGLSFLIWNHTSTAYWPSRLNNTQFGNIWKLIRQSFKPPSWHEVQSCHLLGHYVFLFHILYVALISSMKNSRWKGEVSCRKASGPWPWWHLPLPSLERQSEILPGCPKSFERCCISWHDQTLPRLCYTLDTYSIHFRLWSVVYICIEYMYHIHIYS